MFIKIIRKNYNQIIIDIKVMEQYKTIFMNDYRLWYILIKNTSKF